MTQTQCIKEECCSAKNASSAHTFTQDNTPRVLFHFAVPKPLSTWVSHYEPLNYDTDSLHQSHLRARRSVSEDSTVHLHFKAHKRTFSLRLKRDLDTFSDKLEVVGHTGDSLVVDTSHIYDGHILGKFILVCYA